MSIMSDIWMSHTKWPCHVNFTRDLALICVAFLCYEFNEMLLATFLLSGNFKVNFKEKEHQKTSTLTGFYST